MHSSFPRLRQRWPACTATVVWENKGVLSACQIMARLDAATIPVDAATIPVHLPFHITADALPNSP